MKNCYPLVVISLLLLLGSCGRERPGELSFEDVQERYLDGKRVFDTDGDMEIDWLEEQTVNEAGDTIVTHYLGSTVNDPTKIVWEIGRDYELFREDYNRDSNFEYERKVVRDSNYYHEIIWEDKDLNGTLESRKTAIQRKQFEVATVTVAYDSGNNVYHDLRTYQVKHLLGAEPHPKVSVLDYGVCENNDLTKVENWRKDFKEAFYKGIENGLPCLKRNNPTLYKKLQVALITNNFRIVCLDIPIDPDNPEDIPLGQLEWQNSSDPVNVYQINIDPEIYLYSKKEMEGVFFHELLHTVAGGHYEDGDEKFSDQIYSCERLCFLDPRPTDCMGCRGTSGPAYCGADIVATIEFHGERYEQGLIPIKLDIKWEWQIYKDKTDIIRENFSIREDHPDELCPISYLTTTDTTYLLEQSKDMMKLLSEYRQQGCRRICLAAFTTTLHKNLVKRTNACYGDKEYYSISLLMPPNLNLNDLIHTSQGFSGTFDDTELALYPDILGTLTANIIFLDPIN